MTQEQVGSRTTAGFPWTPIADHRVDGDGYLAGYGRQGEAKLVERRSRASAPNDNWTDLHNHADQRSPPDTLSVSPVTHAAASEARYSTAGAMSSGLPERPSGVSATSCRSKSVPMTTPMSITPSVSVKPGFTALTRMPRGPSSRASACVSVSTAPLVRESIAQI